MSKLETSVCVGYPSHCLKIIVDGPWNIFVLKVFSTFESEVDFLDYLEQYEEELESFDNDQNKSAEISLYEEYKSLKERDSAAITQSQMHTFLSHISDLDRNDEM